MNTSNPVPPVDVLASKRSTLGRLVAFALCAVIGVSAQAQSSTALADQPLFSNNNVPGNVALALSVEFPTAIRAAHTATTYASTTEYLGYFDPNKCYTYNNGASDNERYFVPAGLATNRTCSNRWSGNFLNWATMQTIDPFRWALTGGYRFRDEVGLTVLERAWQSGQNDGLSPNKSIGAATVAGATPFSTTLYIRVANLGNKFRFSTTNSLTGTATGFAGAPTAGTLFEAFVRVKVCDPAASAGGVESNCVRYSATNWKPEGLIQQYSARMRFSAFGYLNQIGNGRDGGVLRARQKFVGPTRPVIGRSPDPNLNGEWDPRTGIFVANPDPTDASATNSAYGTTTVTNSGVMNYLNKFGQTYPGDYKSNDPVGELYYAALRYFRNIGNVPEWSNIPAATPAAAKQTYLDGFPVITQWDDPIQYHCQRNFVIGIGDIYTHADRNVPGNVTDDSGTPMPSAVSADSLNAVTLTNQVGVMQNFQNPLGNYSSGRGNSYRMAGLAYWANTRDIRPGSAANEAGRQSVKTYWVDVLEAPFVPNNQFYLAAKYGGFTVPDNYDVNRTTDLDQTWWASTADTVGAGGTLQQRPDNYFTAGRPDQMVAGLNRVFASIAAQLRAYTTSFSVSSPQVSELGSFSYSSQYDTSNWTGEVTESFTTLDPGTGNPTQSLRWRFSERLATQLAGAGWNTGRVMVTRRPDTGVGVPFRSGSLSAEQLTALDTSYRTGNDSSDYLNYLRGDRTYETTSSVTANRFYRARSTLVGDIVGSKAKPVGPPDFPYTEAGNPGYAAFKAQYANRPTVVYVGTNGGVMHAILGSAATGPNTNAGRELFAYVPSALFNGPTNQAQTSGLAALGNPLFTHHYYVNMTPQVYDVDFQRTVGNTPSDANPHAWRSILIGGLGKGGKSYYAIDVTDPAAMTTEANVASKVLWEFSHPDLGYTFGEPQVVKTRKYGWVVIITSGYNNTDGLGYFFLLNPRTGELLERVRAHAGVTSTSDAGLAHVNAWIPSRRDAVADAAYAGNLQGEVWRLNLTSSASTPLVPYPDATLVARVADSDGNAQPITSRPRIAETNRYRTRYVLFGTGRLLDNTDIASTQRQSFYALIDGRGYFGGFQESAVITRSQLQANTDLLSGLTDVSTSTRGWYYDLGRDPSSNIAWRVILEPEVYSASDVVSWASMLPSINDPCAPSGSSEVYATNYGTGASVLQDVNGNFITSTGLSGAVTDLQFLAARGSSGTTPRLIAGTDTGGVSSLRGNFSTTKGLRLLNWRELKIVE